MRCEILAFYLKLCGYSERHTVTGYIRISPCMLNLRFFSTLVPPEYPNILTQFKRLLPEKFSIAYVLCFLSYSDLNDFMCGNYVAKWRGDRASHPKLSKI